MSRNYGIGPPAVKAVAEKHSHANSKFTTGHSGSTPTAYAGSVGSNRRFRKGFPCPICGGTEDDQRGDDSRCWGFVSEDGEWAHCTRSDHAGLSPLNPGSNAHPHRLKGKCPCGTEHAPADPPPKKTRAGLGTVEAVYRYCDAAGQVVMEAVRYRDPKAFRQRRPTPEGKWAWNLSGVDLVPYRLPELLAAPGRTVLVVEGEKDVDALRSRGFVATCNPMGAGKWRPEFAEHLAGRHVAILPDNDQPGRAHAEQVARSLHGKAASVKVIDLPDLPEHGDVNDFLIRGGTVEDLKRLVKGAEPWSPSAEPHTIPIRSTPPRFGTTDMANGERMVYHHGPDLRYVHQWAKWLIWDDRRWAIDSTAEANRKAKRTVRSIYKEAAESCDDETREKLAKWALSSESKSKIEAMTWCAAREESVSILPSELNREPWLLNCLNGTIELKTGLLRPHRREDKITQLCPVAYDGKSECPLWLSTLDKIFAGNQGLVEFWRRLCGCILTGTVTEQILPILHGTGANGKSTILNTILAMLGPDYSMKAPPDLLIVKRNDSHPTERADLFGKRVVVAIETGEGKRLDEVMVKELTGSDRIRARRMREDFWEFEPTHKVLLCTNHRPAVHGTDHAIWRRLKLVPFSVTIADADADKDMPAKLLGELPGILAWCVRGCLDWQEDGLKPPDEVAAATEEYRQDEDIFGAFLAEECVISPTLRVKSALLWKRYGTWTEGSGKDGMSQRKFGSTLAERGFRRFTNNGTWYQGIGLRADESDGYEAKY